MSELWQLVAGDMQPWQLAIALMAAFATGIFHTLSGFAGGLVLSILIAPIIGVEAIVPVMAVMLMLSGASRMWILHSHLDVASFLGVIVPAVPAIVLGAFVYSYLAPWLISVVLGVFLLLTVAARRPLERRGIRVGPIGLGVVGVTFGLLSGMTIGAGMMLAPFLMGRGLFRERLAAVFAAVALVLNFSKSTVFLSTGTLDIHQVLLGLALAIFSIPGNYVGYAILKRSSLRLHTNFVEALILAAGVAFLIAGLLA